MKPGYLILFCLFFFTLGCSKDKFLVKPTLKVKSFTQTVPIDGDLNFVLEFSQKNGKLSGDSLIFIRNRYNQKPIPVGTPTVDTFSTTLSIQTPNANSAEFSVTLPYTSIHIDNGPGENDTVDYQIALIDNAGNKSDTVRTGKIVIIAP